MLLEYVKEHVYLLVLLSAVILIGCADEAPSEPPLSYDAVDAIAYAQHVQPILTKSCATSGCHDPVSKAAGLVLASWNSVMNGSRHGEAVVPFQVSHSLLTRLFDDTPLRRSHPDIAVPLRSDELRFLKRWIEEGARNDDNVSAVPMPHRRLYVPNQAGDNIAIVDLDRLVVSRYVSAGNSPANDAPHFVVANHHYWYVSLIGAGQVWKFDAHADTLLGTAEVAGSPALLALTPDGSKLYVSQFMTSSTNRVVVLNAATMTVMKTIPVWTMPHGIAVNGAGTRLFVANMMSDNISVIDVATDSVVATIPLAFDAQPFGPPKYMPMEIVVSPDDTFIVVTCSEWREVRMFNAATYALVDSFHVGDQPWHLQVSPDGQFCYVANRRGHTVSVIHVPMRHVMSTVTSPAHFSSPHGVDISRDGRFTFVSNENLGHLYTPRYATEFVGNVCVIDNVLGQVVKTLDVGLMPTGLSVSR